MSKSISAFQDQLAQSPEIVDGLFQNGKFNVATLLEGAHGLGHVIAADELDDDVRDKSLSGSLSFMVPDSATGGITEMTNEELEQVAAGADPEDKVPGAPQVAAVISASVAVVVFVA